jgi:hypothetical protein
MSTPAPLVVPTELDATQQKKLIRHLYMYQLSDLKKESMIFMAGAFLRARGFGGVRAALFRGGVYWLLGDEFSGGEGAGVAADCTGAIIHVIASAPRNDCVRSVQARKTNTALISSLGQTRRRRTWASG